jgi:trigger factor
MKINIKKLEKSEVEITSSIDKEEFLKYEEKALEKIGERAELPGFRKGKAPTNIIKANVPEMELLEEMAELAIGDNYVKILEENKIDAIGRPDITITKIGRGADLEFKIKTAVLPEVELPNYKKISKTENSKEEYKKEILIEEKDVEKIINDLRKMRAEQKSHENHEGHENMTEEEHTKAHSESKEIPESDWPLFNDEFAKTFGDFKTAEELKEKIKNNLKTEKETEQKDKLRLSIIEKIIEETKVEIPEILIKGETDKIMYKLQADITNIGFKVEDYLKQIGKTEEELRKEWRPDAEKRAKLQMIIHAIVEKEDLKPTEEEIQKDVTQITSMYKEADEARARIYVEQMLENEKVFKFLEQQ